MPVDWAIVPWSLIAKMENLGRGGGVGTTAVTSVRSIAYFTRICQTQALDLARCREPLGSIGKKLEIIQRAAQHDYSVGDIDGMLGRDRSRIRNRCTYVILVDSNVPMYLVGAPHPHKADAQRCSRG
jgi:hypothetical protein